MGIADRVGRLLGRRFSLSATGTSVAIGFVGAVLCLCCGCSRESSASLAQGAPSDVGLRPDSRRNSSKSTFAITLHAEGSPSYRDLVLPATVHRKQERPEGLVSSIFLSSCEWGSSIESALTSEAASAEVHELLRACRFEGDRRVSAELGAEGKVVFRTAAPEEGRAGGRVARGVLVVSYGKAAEAPVGEWRIAETMLFH
jgi:hypothetical protein